MIRTKLSCKRKKGMVGPGVLMGLVIVMIILAIVIYALYTRSRLALATSSCEETHNGKCIEKGGSCPESHPQAFPYSCPDDKKCCISLGG